MRSRITGPIIALAAGCLSILSIYTTAQGFSLYVNVPWLGWIAASAVQIIILFILFKKFSRWAYILWLPTYLALLLFSAGGSFLLIDERLSLRDRQVQMTRSTCQDTSQFIDRCVAYAQARLDLVDVLKARLEDYKNTEESRGSLSGVGPGRGPMFEEIGARIGPFSSAHENLSAGINGLESCRFKYSLEDLSNNSKSTTQKCEQQVPCGNKVLARLPQDPYLERLLRQTQTLFQMAKYKTVIPDMPSSGIPSQPPVSNVGSSDLQQRLEGAKDDLLTNRRFSTWLSLVLALALEILLLFIALVSRLEGKASSERSEEDELVQIIREARNPRTGTEQEQNNRTTRNREQVPPK